MTWRQPTTLTHIRNIGIVAHVDAGKTTLTERILFHTGRIHAIGEVHNGNAATDFHPIEQKRGITILAAAVTCDWSVDDDSYRIHLIDTPGHVDFTIEVERSLRVLDGAVVVLDGVAGVQPQTETVWRQADRHRVPRLVFVNKLDRAGGDFDRCVGEVASRLRARPIAINAPLYEGERIVGVIDLVAQTAIRWDRDDAPNKPTVTPVQLSDNLQAARDRLLEACADEDPTVLAAIVDGRPLASDVLWRALRQATLGGRIVPVLAGAAYRHKGVEPLLDAVVRLLPAPPTSERTKLSAFAFKVVFDDYGQLTFVRVYDGVIRSGDTVVAARADRKLRVGRLVQLVANNRIEVDALSAGEIGAVVGLPLAGGETICAPDQPHVLEPIHAPEPVMRVAVEAKTAADRERLGVALGRMIAADPSLRIESNPETGQTLLAGMGQLHLEIAAERLANEHRVAVVTGRPLVAYRTTLERTARVEYTHAKQSGGPGQWARVVLELGPAERGAGIEFVDRIKGGAIAREYIRGVEAGVRAAASDGLAVAPLRGYPLVDIRVALIDGATHPNDSSELAFHIAGAFALRIGAVDAAPCLLEPVMLLEVTCGESEIGAVVGDIARRRGEVLALEVVHHDHVVRARVPLAEAFGYAGALSALTHGRGRFTLEPASYERVAD